VIAPKLLITTKPGKMKKCIIEVLNSFLRYDQDSNIVEVSSNVLLLNSSLNPNVAYGVIISRPPSCISKVYPIHLSINSTSEKIIIESIKEYFLQNFRNIKSAYCRCYNRNIKFDCRSLEMGVGMALKDNILINYKNPDIVIVVNVIPNYALISFIKKAQEKVSV